MMTETDQQQEEKSEDEFFNHIVCCRDDNLGLCGADLTDVEFKEESEDPLCEVCAQVEETLMTITDGDTSREACPGCWVALLS